MSKNWRLLILLVLITVLSGCGQQEQIGYIQEDQVVAATTQASADDSRSKSLLILNAANNYLTQGRAPAMSVKDLYLKVVQGGDPNYFIVSVRKPEDYAKGHIPGAVNIPYGTIYKPENLAKIPKNKKIVVVCYTGHTSSQVAMFLSELGYEAYALKYGMMGWTTDPEVLANKPFTQAMNYPVETTPVEAKANNSLPLINDSATELKDLLINQTKKYLTAGRAPAISPQDVYQKVVQAKDSSYLVVSVRKPEDYAKGHIPGAINIPYGKFATEANLKKLPKDKKLIIVCYTGHTSSQITMLLNQLGYEAYALKYGMMGWTSDPKVLNTATNFTAPNYPCVAGTNP